MSSLQNGSLGVYELGESETEEERRESERESKRGGGNFIVCSQCLSGRLLPWLAGSQHQHSIHFVLEGGR